MADYWSNFRCRQEGASLYRSPLGRTSEFWSTKFGAKKLETSLYRTVQKVYFATLNRLGVHHECNRRTDVITDVNRTDVNYVARSNIDDDITRLVTLHI